MRAVYECAFALLALLNSHQPAHSSHPAPQRASRGVHRTEPDWAALRRCESGGDYANKRNPTYRGAYQFSRSTWASVGGHGDPADAAAEEQDMRARRLFQRSGRGQWPGCGRRL